jgi:hypothetical protein
VAENAWFSGLPGSLPPTLGGRSDLDEAPALLLRGTRLCLSMAPSLDGVTNVTVVADLMSRGRTPADAEEKGHAFAPTKAWRPGFVAGGCYC